jgi:hypothetical protein
MGLGIAKIHEDTVPHISRDETLKAVHGSSDAFLISRNNFAQVLWVHLGRECRRTDKIREHHRELAPLGALLGVRLLSRGRFRCRRGSAGKLRDSREQFPPMSERDADVLEVLIGQIAEYRDIDLVLGKGLGILGHPELFEPIRNLLHRGASRPRTCLGLTELLDPGTEFIRKFPGLVHRWD